MAHFKRTNPMPTAPQGFVLVPREQLRVHDIPKLSDPQMRRVALPQAVPPSLDLSKGRQTKYPILGNDRYGDCYLAAVLHQVQQWTGLYGSEVQYDVNAVVSYYLQLSGGDNGLSDQQIYPAWKSGIPLLDARAKLIDCAVVDIQSDSLINESMYFCGGLLWTCSLESTWLNATSPGSVWDAGGRPDPQAGHAMCLSGYEAGGNLVTETWAIDPPIRVTRRGMREADSELVACVSLAAFGPDGRTSAGETYQTVADWWHSRTGRTLPPFPDPIPPTPGPAPSPSWICPILAAAHAWAISQLGGRPVLLMVESWAYGMAASELGCVAARTQGKRLSAGEVSQLQAEFDGAMAAAIAHAGPGTLTGIFLSAIQTYVDAILSPAPVPPPPGP